MYTFFTNYWTAINAASGTAGFSIDEIVSIIDPVTSTGIGSTADDIMSALTFGLSLIRGPEDVVTSALFRTTQQIPTLAGFLFPQNTIDSEVQEMQQISANFGQIGEQLRDNVAQALATVMNNSTLFYTFASSGAFSGNSSGSNLNTLTNNLLLGLMTYLISQAYQSNGVTITR